MSTHVRCDRLLVTVLELKLNFGVVSTSDKIFIKIVSEENLSCKCCESEAFVFCYAKGVCFKNKIFSLGSESLSPKGLPIWVLFGRFNVGFGVQFVNVCLLGVEDGKHGLNWPKVQLLNAGMIVFGFGVQFVNMHLPGVEDGRHGLNYPKVQLLKVGMMVSGFGLSSCG